MEEYVWINSIDLANAIIKKRNETAITQAEAIRKLREALQEITKREGAYSRDPLTHASNTIDQMAEIASAVLEATK